MTTEQYSIGYDEGYQAGWNAAMDAKPAQQEPLTDEEIVTVAKFIDIEFKDEGYEQQLDDILTFARAIEAKLKEKNT